MRRAVIDLSLASISYLVADQEASRLRSIYKDSVQFSANRYMSPDGILSEKGMGKLFEDLEEIGSHLSALSVERTDMISTSLLRSLSNGNDVKKAVEERTGLGITELSGKDEAYALWYANERYSVLENALLINIGGTTTKICAYDEGDVSAMISLPFGSAGLYHEFVSLDFPTRAEMKKMKDHVKSLLSSLEERDYENAVLSGANLRAIWRLYREEYEIDDSPSENLMQRGKLKKLIDVLLEEKKGRKLMTENCPSRFFDVIPTAVALKCILTHYKINNMTVSPLGVKEGFMKWKIDREREEEK